MQIDDIKPPSNHSVSDCQTDAPLEQRTNGDFAAVKNKLQSGVTELVPHKTLDVVTRFSHVELEDPSKLEQMVRASVSELIDSGAEISGPLSSAQKGLLVDMLSQDPLLRRNIHNYLRKVLT